ncbi:NIL domain [Raoultella ornithinolytica]|nr:NIL domain [Raoultella ornithinolytica]
MASVWQPATRGDAQHDQYAASRSSGENLSSVDGSQLVTLHFDGSSGGEPDLHHIAALLGDGARLLYGNCEQIQGRVIGQLRIRLPRPLDERALGQHGWVADRLTLATDLSVENSTS